MGFQYESITKVMVAQYEMSTWRLTHPSRQTEAGPGSAPLAELAVALWDAHTERLSAGFNAAGFTQLPGGASHVVRSRHRPRPHHRDESIAEKGRELGGRFAGQLFRKEVAGADPAAPNVVGPLAPDLQRSAGIGVPGA